MFLDILIMIIKFYLNWLQLLREDSPESTISNPTKVSNLGW